MYHEGIPVKWRFPLRNPQRLVQAAGAEEKATQKTLHENTFTLVPLQGQAYADSVVSSVFSIAFWSVMPRRLLIVLVSVPNALAMVDTPSPCL